MLLFIFLSTSLLFFFPSFFFLMIPPPPKSTLFPYTPLFRSGTTGDPKGVVYHHRGAFLLAERRSEEHTSELQSHVNLVCRLLLEKKKKKKKKNKNKIKKKNKRIH